MLAGKPSWRWVVRIPSPGIHKHAMQVRAIVSPATNLKWAMMLTGHWCVGLALVERFAGKCGRTKRCDGNTDGNRMPRPHRPNEKEMSDGGRGRASLGVEV